MRPRRLDRGVQLQRLFGALHERRNVRRDGIIGKDRPVEKERSEGERHAPCGRSMTAQHGSPIVRPAGTRQEKGFVHRTVVSKFGSSVDSRCFRDPYVCSF